MQDSEKEMYLRYSGKCSLCGVEIDQGTRAIYNSTARSVRHIDCSVKSELGAAGASAQREYERRKASDERRIEVQKAKVAEVYGTGFIGKVATLLAVDDRPRQSTQAWAKGAIGEERVAAVLDPLAEVGVLTLHDRRIRGTRANIDHIAVTPWGVWVIDAKRYLDKRPELQIEGGFMGIGGRMSLAVGGRKHDELVDGVLKQVERVREVLGTDVPVRGALAFVDADWPLLSDGFQIRDVAVVWPKRLVKLLLKKEQPSFDVEEIARKLASAFPIA